MASLKKIIAEWVGLCENFQHDHQTEHEWDEEKCFRMMWRGIVSSKHLNPTLIEEYIEILPKLNEDSEGELRTEMCRNPAITLDMILAHPVLGSKGSYIGSKYMHINDILKHPEFEWEWDYISMNSSLTIDIVVSNRDKPWDWYCLSRHVNITVSDIESHMDLPWDWKGVSNNPNLTMLMVETYPDKSWDWEGISGNMKLSADLFGQHPDKPWNFDSMCLCNPSITLELLLATPHLGWNYFRLSFNVCLTIDMVLAFPETQWEWDGVSGNAGITMSDIESHVDLPWNWNYVSSNPNVRMCHIEKHVDKPWNWNNFSYSIFQPNEFMDQHLC